MLPREWDDKLYEIAEGQLGYFTAARIRDVGVLQVRLVQLHKRGDIERVSRGVLGRCARALGAARARGVGSHSKHHCGSLAEWRLAIGLRLQRCLCLQTR